MNSKHRWAPPPRRFHTGVRRSCQRLTFSSGDRPCSTNRSAPEGLSTRRISRKAAFTSGIVQSVQVATTVSMLLSSSGSASARNPRSTRSTRRHSDGRGAPSRAVVAMYRARPRRASTIVGITRRRHWRSSPPSGYLQPTVAEEAWPHAVHREADSSHEQHQVRRHSQQHGCTATHDRPGDRHHEKPPRHGRCG